MTNFLIAFLEIRKHFIKSFKFLAQSMKTFQTYFLVYSEVLLNWFLIAPRLPLPTKHFTHLSVSFISISLCYVFVFFYCFLLFSFFKGQNTNNTENILHYYMYVWDTISLLHSFGFISLTRINLPMSSQTKKKRKRKTSKRFSVFRLLFLFFHENGKWKIFIIIIKKKVLLLFFLFLVLLMLLLRH